MNENDNKNKDSLAEDLYRQNIEIVGKNKILSLLSKLYSISILGLNPVDITKRIVDVYNEELNTDLAAIYLFNNKTSKMQILALSHQSQIDLPEPILNIETQHISYKGNRYFESIISGKSKSYTTDMNLAWGVVLKPEVIAKLKDGKHFKANIAYALTIDGSVRGVLSLSFNRLEKDLNHYEKDSIRSSIDVVSVALGKALLYEELATANQKLKALDKARAEFITIASHQLRTPPATIKWYIAEIMAGDYGKISKKVAEGLQVVRVTNDAQISTISDLLNASRIERGKLEFFFEKGDLNQLTADLVTQLTPLASMKKLTLSYTPAKKVLPVVIMDQEKIRQVMNNMIDNAIKYSQKGTIVVNLSVVGKNAQFSVSDQGKGIEPNQAKKLFKKFTRGADSATQSTGLGLGMYVAKVIIDQHNGKIWAESDGVDQGSTFIFSIPLKNSIKSTMVDLAKSRE